MQVIMQKKCEVILRTWKYKIDKMLSDAFDNINHELIKYIRAIKT